MNISLLVFGGLLVGIVVAGLLPRHWLFAAWVMSFLVFPTLRVKIGEAPIYLYDLFAVALILCVLPHRDLKAWPKGVPRCHWWFIGTAFLLSVIFGVVQHGMVAEISWIWVHTSLAWMAFSFGVIVASSEERDRYRNAVAFGILLSSMIVCVVAVIQYAELPGTSFLSNLFYGDLGSEESVELLRHGLETNRAPGPHFAPTTLAGMALLSVVGFWLVTDEKARWQRWLLMGLSGVTMLCTVSRHAVLAALIGLVVAIALSEGRKRVRLIIVVGMTAFVVATPAVGYLFKESWASRLSKWDEGVLQDENTTARVLAGPVRLMEFISNEPLVLLTGAGLDPEKLAAKSKHEANFDGGFVSNGFLLMLYYLGVGGFLLHGVFWLWACYIAWKFPARFRGAACGFVAIAFVIVAADNYSVTYEPAIALLFLIVGLVGGQWGRESEADVLGEPLPETAEKPPETEESLPEKAYAA